MVIWGCNLGDFYSGKRTLPRNVQPRGSFESDEWIQNGSHKCKLFREMEDDDEQMLDFQV